ncbi:MAG TPA: DUF366 family protein [bacterium]|jgi:hypothetical protein|nr:DUF366 family protein [bacterium]
MPLRTRLLAGTHPYDGSPLKGHWAYTSHGIQGDSLVAFEGPCEVAVEALADLEDARAGAFIYSPRMLHFVLELFGPDLEQAVSRQWLMAATAQDEVNRSQKRARCDRDGNDLWVGKRKLSVSIAAPTLVSVKVHLGLNIDAEGAPVKAIGLKDLGIATRAFALRLLERFSDDHARMRGARTKVRPYL